MSATHHLTAAQRDKLRAIRVIAEEHLTIMLESDLARTAMSAEEAELILDMRRGLAQVIARQQEIDDLHE